MINKEFNKNLIPQDMIIQYKLFECKNSIKHLENENQQLKDKLKIAVKALSDVVETSGSYITFDIAEQAIKQIDAIKVEG